MANLNALTAQHAVAQFLALVNGAEFARWDYLHFDQFTGRTIPATTTSREECQLCGCEGCLGAGDPVPETAPVPRTSHLKRLLLKA